MLVFSFLKKNYDAEPCCDDLDSRDMKHILVSLNSYAFYPKINYNQNSIIECMRNKGLNFIQIFFEITYKKLLIATNRKHASILKFVNIVNI